MSETECNVCAEGLPGCGNIVTDPSIPTVSILVDEGGRRVEVTVSDPDSAKAAYIASNRVEWSGSPLRVRARLNGELLSYVQKPAEEKLRLFWVAKGGGGVVEFLTTEEEEIKKVLNGDPRATRDFKNWLETAKKGDVIEIEGLGCGFCCGCQKTLSRDVDYGNWKLD